MPPKKSVSEFWMPFQPPCLPIWLEASRILSESVCTKFAPEASSCTTGVLPLGEVSGRVSPGARSPRATFQALRAYSTALAPPAMTRGMFPKIWSVRSPRPFWVAAARVEKIFAGL